MTATEELRRLLDERGVEWMPSVFDPQHETFYSVENGVGFIVTEFPEIGRISLACDMRITPEQAIAATLGDADATGERQAGAVPMDEVRDFFYRCVPADIERWRGEDFQRVTHFFGAKVVGLQEKS